MPLKRLPGVHSALQAGGALMGVGAPLEAPQTARAAVTMGAKTVPGLRDMVEELIQSTANSTGNILGGGNGETNDLTKDMVPNTDLHKILMQRRMAAMGETLPKPSKILANEQIRPDGTQKGPGFLGTFPVPGGETGEYSTASEDHPELGDYPTFVPTLHTNELNQLLNHIAGNGPFPKAVGQKALEHALLRRNGGQPVFAQEGEQNPNIMPYLKRIP